VCAKDAQKVLNKPTTPSEDGYHYYRNIAGVGNVEKIMVGRPKGIAVDQDCGSESRVASSKDSLSKVASEAKAKLAAEDKEGAAELEEHLANQLPFLADQ
jgi:hypothetical protein